jgi:predicted dienelactone hydrolase
MRPLETLELVLNLLAVLGLAIPRRRALSRARDAAALAPASAGAQALVEGPRWQMVPAYALSGVLLLVWLLGRGKRAGSVDRHRRAERIVAVLGAGVGILALVISSVLPIALPVFQFPRPTGPFAIGTLTYHWVDPDRREIFSADPNARRELIVQIWYPATGDRSSPRAPYLENPEVLTPTARLIHLPGFIFGHLKDVTTNAIPSAPVADDEPTYPVLIFLSGRGGYRQSNTFQVEDLVSHGYVVAGLDQPYAAGGVVFPDGRLVAMDPRLYDPAHPGHSAYLDGVLPFLAQDVTFTLDRLAALNQADPNGILTGRLDLQREGIFGVSLGGIVTGEACLHEPRLRACLVMDAFMPADVVQAGLEQPAMWLSRDAPTMQREGWTQADVDETQTTMRAVYARLTGDGYLVLVPGMFHLNFTDAPLLSPLGSLVGLSGPIDAQRAFDIVNAYSLAFFDRHVKGQPAPLLDGPATQYPEVIFSSKEVHR